MMPQARRGVKLEKRAAARQNRPQSFTRRHWTNLWISLEIRCMGQLSVCFIKTKLAAP